MENTGEKKEKERLAADELEWVIQVTTEQLERLGKIVTSAKTPPKVSANIMRGTINVRYGREVLGRLTKEEVATRNTDAIASMFDLKSAIKLSVVDLTEQASKILYAVSDAIAAGLQAVYREHLARPIEDNLATRAYQISNEAITTHMASQKDAIRRMTRPCGAVVAAGSKAYADKFSKWERTKFKASPPWPKSSGFSIPSDLFRLELLSSKPKKKGGKPVVIVPGAKVQPREAVYLVIKPFANPEKKGGKLPELRLRVEPHGSSQWALLKALLNGPKSVDDPPLTLKSSRMVLHEGKWTFSLSVSKPRPNPSNSGGVILVVMPTANSVVSVVSSEAKLVQGRNYADESIPKGVDSEGLIATKLKYDGMIAQRARHLPFRGKGARGHGKGRALAAIRGIRERESRYVTSWIEQQGKHVSNYAVFIKASAVLVDDMAVLPQHTNKTIEAIMRRFPYCTFRDRVLNDTEREGILARSIKHSGSNNCPMCGAEGTLTTVKCRGTSDEYDSCTKCEMVQSKLVLRAWRIIRLAGLATPAIEESFTQSTKDVTDRMNKSAVAAE